MLMLQRSLEKMELAEPPAPEDGAAHGIKDVSQTVSTPSVTNQE